MNQISFDDYLLIDALNYSTLKSVSDKGRLFNFYKKEESASMSLGNVVEDLVLPTKDPSKYFILRESPPTASTLVLADAVVDHCKKNNLDPNLIINDGEFLNDLVVSLGLWSKMERPSRENRYLGDKQFNEYICSKFGEAKAIALEMWDKANHLAKILKEHPHTKDIISTGENQLSYVFKLKLFRERSVTYKIRIDKLIIDHENKVIKPFDLKTGHIDASQFEINFYIFKYYLQLSLYSIGVAHFRDKYYPDYSIDNFKFIYISTTEPNPYPVIWEASEEWVKLGFEGFYNGSRYNKGIEELTKEYLFYMDNSTEMDMNISLNNGTIKIPLPS